MSTTEARDGELANAVFDVVKDASMIEALTALGAAASEVLAGIEDPHVRSDLFDVFVGMVGVLSIEAPPEQRRQ